nr:ATP-binding protein [Comamonas thiooxydans]
MLKKFEVSNFKNFGVNLEFDLSKTNGYEFNKECVVNGLVNKALVYGYNGVGKSNLGFAIFDLISHTTDRYNSAHSYKNYLYAGAVCEMAVFKYTFMVGGGEVYYEYGKSDLETIVYERLVINGSDFASVDRRNSTAVEINARGAETLKRDLGESQISIVQYIKNNSLLEESFDNDCFKAFLTFVDGMLFFRSLDQNNYIGFEQGSNGIQKDIISKGQVEDFEKFLNDAGIECKLTAVTGEDEPYIALDFNNRKIKFFECASQGTKSLALFYYWYQRLKGADSKVTFLFVDEFDAFYHYSLSILIIKLLRDIKSQVIITTHNTSVMTNELLRPDCYFFIDAKGIHSLSNSTPKELREAHNIEKMYRAGAFSG